MSTVAQLAIVTGTFSKFHQTSKCFGFSFHIDGHNFTSVFASTTTARTVTIRNRTKAPLLVTCSAAKPSSSSDISYSRVDKFFRGFWKNLGIKCTLLQRLKDLPLCIPQLSAARIRSEVLTPFRSVRMFFYIAFIAQASLGGLIATTQLIGALANPSRADAVIDIAKGLGIDIGAASVFAFLYYRENKIKNAQMSRLSREENLSNLKLRVDEKKIIPVSEFRGLARLVILAGPSSFITEAFKRSETFTEQLIERGVLVVPFPTDGNAPTFEFDETEDMKELTNKRRRLWQLVPVLTPEWSEWLDEQKKLANVSPESPVYLSLRLDGRVRGSGVGYPPWNAFVAQLPPVKGMWSGLLDGMDGRVL